jgi:excisionase family DNA binding protein
MNKQLLTPEEVADVLGVGRSKVYELMGSRALRSVKLGHARRVTTTALREYIEELAGEPV